MKKILLITLLFLSLFGFTSVSAKSSTEMISEREKKQAQSLWHYQNLLKSSKFYANFNDEFGGVYLDKEGNLVINIVKGKMNNFITRLDVNEKAIIIEVDYSLEQIKNEMKKMESLFEEFDIVSVARSEELNTLIITIDENYYENKIAIEQISSLKNLVIIRKDTSISIQDTTAYTTNGDQATINGQTYTIGFAARNSNGDLGFVTSGHGGMNNGDDVYCYSSHCGDVNGHYFSATIDASFVKLRYNWLPSKSFMNGDSYYMIDSVGTYVVAGTILATYGDVSGKTTGVIQQTAVSFYNEYGVLLIDFVQADYVAIHGDSGAAVTFLRYVGTGIYLRTVIGIQSQSFLNVNKEWVPGTSYCYFSRADNILDDLDLTGY